MLDIVQRYVPVVNIARKNYNLDRRIVEVGGEGEGIGHYLKDFEVFDCDLRFDDRVLSNTMPFVIRKGKLPLVDDFADCVIAVDVFEHLSSQKEKRDLIREMLRVAKKRIVLVIPTGKKGFLAHLKLADFILKFYPKRNSVYLQEHLQYGHPEKKEILDLIRGVGCNLRVKTGGNTNIGLWFLFQKFYLKYPGFYRLFRYRNFWYYALSLFWPFLNFEPTMRTVFNIQIKDD